MPLLYNSTARLTILVDGEIEPKDDYEGRSVEAALIGTYIHIHIHRKINGPTFAATAALSGDR